MSEELEIFLQENKNKKIVFTNGCFDILHRGHIIYLNEAKSLGDVLVVGLNSDLSVRKLKGDERPVNNQEDRKFLLENLKAVDHVVVFSQQTPLALIKKIKPEFLVKGGDWKIQNIVGHDEVLSYGGKVKSLSLLDNYSTSGLIERINNQ